jgi:hypothetical protein
LSERLLRLTLKIGDRFKYSTAVAFKRVKLPSITKVLSSFSTNMKTLSTSASFSSEREWTAFKASYASFLAYYPTYQDTSILDRLRKDEYSRLDKAKEIYADYMGGCLWPKKLVAGHASLLESGLFGNTHSDSPL